MQELLYQELDKNLYKRSDAVVVSDANPTGGQSALSFGSGVSVTTSGDLIDPSNIISGSLAGNLEFTGGYIQSANFIAGTSGWKLDSNGTLTAVNATLSGTITATSGTIGGFSITSTAIQTAASGDRVVMSSSDKSFAVYDSSGIVARIGINAGYGIQLTPTSVTNNGIQISSSQAGVGISYSNSANVSNTGIDVNLTSTGVNNTGPGVDITHNGGGKALLLTVTNTATGIYLDNSGSSYAIQIVDTGTTGTTPGFDMSYARSGKAVSISTTNVSATALYVRAETQGAAMVIENTESGGNVTGIKLNINNSGGNESAFEFAGAEVVSSAVGGSQNKKVRVIIGGTVYYIPCYDA